MTSSVLRKELLSRCALFVILMVACMLPSCHHNDETKEAQKRSEFAQIIDERSSKDILNELYIASDGDGEALARILQVTPSSIERLRKGETYPTDEFQVRLKEVATYYAQHDKSFRELRSALDSEYKWYDAIKDYPFKHVTGFVITLIVLIILVSFVSADILWLMLLASLVWGIAFGLSWALSPDTMKDSYTDCINPNIEVLVGDVE